MVCKMDEILIELAVVSFVTRLADSIIMVQMLVLRIWSCRTERGESLTQTLR